MIGGESKGLEVVSSCSEMSNSTSSSSKRTKFTFKIKTSNKKKGLESSSLHLPATSIRLSLNDTEEVSDGEIILTRTSPKPTSFTCLDLTEDVFNLDKLQKDEFMFKEKRKIDDDKDRSKFRSRKKERTKSRHRHQSPKRVKISSGWSSDDMSPKRLKSEVHLVHKNELKPSKIKDNKSPVHRIEPIRTKARSRTLEIKTKKVEIEKRSITPQLPEIQTKDSPKLENIDKIELKIDKIEAEIPKNESTEVKEKTVETPIVTVISQRSNPEYYPSTYNEPTPVNNINPYYYNYNYQTSYYPSYSYYTPDFSVPPPSVIQYPTVNYQYQPQATQYYPPQTFSQPPPKLPNYIQPQITHQMSPLDQYHEVTSSTFTPNEVPVNNTLKIPQPTTPSPPPHPPPSMNNFTYNKPYRFQNSFTRRILNKFSTFNKCNRFSKMNRFNGRGIGFVRRPLRRMDEELDWDNEETSNVQHVKEEKLEIEPVLDLDRKVDAYQDDLLSIKTKLKEQLKQKLFNKGDDDDEEEQEEDVDVVSSSSSVDEQTPVKEVKRIRVKIRKRKLKVKKIVCKKLKDSIAKIEMDEQLINELRRSDRIKVIETKKQVDKEIEIAKKIRKHNSGCNLLNESFKEMSSLSEENWSGRETNAESGIELRCTKEQEFNSNEESMESPKKVLKKCKLASDTPPSGTDHEKETRSQIKYEQMEPIELNKLFPSGYEIIEENLNICKRLEIIFMF